MRFPCRLKRGAPRRYGGRAFAKVALFFGWCALKKVAKNLQKKKGGEIDPAFVPVAAAFADDPRVGRGKMFGSSSVLTVNGKIFAMVVKGRFVAKLPKERVDALVNRGSGEYFDPGHGRLMKEWIVVDAEKAAWVELAREAYRFVGGAES